MRTLLVIGYVWPEPDSSAAGSRMLQILRFFLNKEYKVTFATTAVMTNRTADLECLGISCKTIVLNHPSFDEFVANMQPDVVLFDRFMMEEQFGWRVLQEWPQAIRILDMEDLHFLRQSRRKDLDGGEKIPAERRMTQLAKREIASIYRCDLTLVISNVEMKILQENFGVPPFLLLYLPFMEETRSEEDRVKLPSFSRRKNFISIGNFRHEPNWAAVRLLKEQIWPKIRRELPDAELHVYGAYSAQKVTQLHSKKEGFLVKGWTPSVSTVFCSSRILLAPLTFGAGLKGKFIDAMKYGTPSVTTTVGAEGMTENHLWCGSIEDDVEHFAFAAAKLYTCSDSWRCAQQKGFDLLERNFSKERYQALFSERLEVLSEHLEDHRQQNFTGAMLHHHQLSSSKYFGKYLELKNRLAEIDSKNKDRPSGRSNPNK